MNDRRQAWANGGMIFAATMLVIVGIFQIFEGIAAIAEDNFFVVGPNYAYEIDTTAWGWIHLGVGIVVAAAGFFLFTGAMVAKVIGIAVAVVSAVANFFFLPYYPLWSLLIIALNIFVIWAIANARTLQDMATPEELAMATRGRDAYAGEAGRTGERWPAANEPASAAGRHWATSDAERERAMGGQTTAGGTTGGQTTAGGAYPSEEQARSAEQVRRRT